MYCGECRSVAWLSKIVSFVQFHVCPIQTCAAFRFDLLLQCATPFCSGATLTVGWRHSAGKAFSHGRTKAFE